MSTVLQSAARISNVPHGLRSVHDSECSLAIWQRPALNGIENLLNADLPDLRFNAKLAEIGDVLARELDDKGYRKCAARDDLVADIVELAQTYGATMSIDHIQLRLEVVTTNSCRKFHADYVTARLITTYVGSGTQWLETDDADRVAAGDEPCAIRSLETGHVGLFKGKLGQGSPIIHRSPPIEGTGETRLLLVLNPAEDH